MSCKPCANNDCDCPPEKEIGCITPCLPNQLNIVLGKFGSTCVDLRTANLTSVRLLIYQGTATGNIVEWHKDSVNDPSAFDLSPTYNVLVNIDAADTVGWDGSKPFYYEFYITLVGDTNETLLFKGKMCVVNVQSSMLQPVNVNFTSQRTGRNFLFTVTSTNPHENYQFLEYQWDFGDGTTQTTILNTVSHVYNDDNEYEVCVTAVYEPIPSTSTNPCVDNVTGMSCMTVEPCILDAPLPIPVIYVEACNSRWIDKYDFWFNFLDNQWTFNYPLTWDISLTVDGTVYAQNTILSVNDISQAEQVFIEGFNQLNNVFTYLNSLNTPLQFELVAGTDGSNSDIVIRKPELTTTFTLTITKGYNDTPDVYQWTESAYTGDNFGSAFVYTCNPIP